MTTFSGRVTVSEPLEVVTGTMRTLLHDACEGNAAQGKSAQFVAEPTTRPRLSVSGDGEVLTLAFDISRGATRGTTIAFAGTFDGPMVSLFPESERASYLVAGVEAMLAESGFTILGAVESRGLG